MTCYQSGDFSKYFKENMTDLGLPVPNTLFDTYNATISTATTIVGTLATLGKSATIGELIGATVGLEKLAVAASIGAVAYTGAVIGSAAVATGRSLGCGSTISDFFVSNPKLKFAGAELLFAYHPEIVQQHLPNRATFAVKAKRTPGVFEYATC
ncbi:hypothetical protein GCM10009092_01620 [Bowmanella denitrificans]|uniref:Uncharacterized protein n=1 Tax=Bowmanella denitrificans TaxID=366582 RepID=A0ABN0WKZ0_9ALTE